MAARHRRHRVEAPKPASAWLVTIKAVPPVPTRGDAAKMLAASARSPILLSPSAWQKCMPVGDRGEDRGRAGVAEDRLHGAGQGRTEVPEGARPGLLEGTGGAWPPVRQPGGATDGAVRAAVDGEEVACILQG
ncbi:hypothetical protein ZWY2020_053790 [Hordeum vulgare]|nr:hypothetical protein ZWY2020_053790 [Hordeum vulgare]